ncbi:hypothetical protein SAMN05445850_4761 [Paraburkholderia tuberum]|uniref:Uncharacterized protein n=1 Tax=Paraburkholderia tuberum TaxID=157910 RepID=A0A1H1JFQ7_9BURK|nr:hypothetical protein SAMN05445850_4761 [Paraburkholderia tuberum]
MRKLGAAAPLQCASLCESVHVAMKLCGARREFNGTLIASCKSLERRSFRWKATAKRRLQRQEVFDPCTSDQPIAARIVSLLDGDSLDAVYRDWPRSDAAPMARVSRSADTARSRDRGWETYVDDCANLFFRRNCLEDLPPVLTGNRYTARRRTPGRRLRRAGRARSASRAGSSGHRDTASCRGRRVDERGRQSFCARRGGSSAFVDPALLAGYRESRDAAGIRFGDALDEALAATPVIAVT